MTHLEKEKRKKLDALKTQVHKLLLTTMLLCEDSKKQKALDEIEELLQDILEDHSEDLFVVQWVYVSLRGNSKIEEKTLHALYTLNKENPDAELTLSSVRRKK